MNILMRLKKLEAAGPDPNICKCPDAIAYGATPYFETCCQCEKPIDIKTWPSWTLIEPGEPECTGAEVIDGIDCAFALQRREAVEL